MIESGCPRPGLRGVLTGRSQPGLAGRPCLIEDIDARKGTAVVRFLDDKGGGSITVCPGDIRLDAYGFLEERLHSETRRLLELYLGGDFPEVGWRKDVLQRAFLGLPPEDVVEVLSAALPGAPSGSGRFAGLFSGVGTDSPDPSGGI